MKKCSKLTWTTVSVFVAYRLFLLLLTLKMSYPVEHLDNFQSEIQVL